MPKSLTSFDADRCSYDLQALCKNIEETTGTSGRETAGTKMEEDQGQDFDEGVRSHYSAIDISISKFASGLLGTLSKG